MARVDRRTVDLSAYPDLVVIYLGMRVNALFGLKSLVRLRSPLLDAMSAKPDGLLSHETMVFSLFPVHAAMRQYWRDYASLEAWTRSPPHRDWWQNFLRDSGGTGFWHEAYFMRGGMEAIYDDMPRPIGFGAVCTTHSGIWKKVLVAETGGDIGRGALSAGSRGAVIIGSQYALATIGTLARVYDEVGGAYHHSAQR